jgi:hypothetical protein
MTSEYNTNAIGGSRWRRATGWAIFARSAGYSGNSIPTVASTVIPASLTNPTNQPESYPALWAY